MPRALPRRRLSVRLRVGDRIMVRPTSRYANNTSRDVCRLCQSRSCEWSVDFGTLLHAVRSLDGCKCNVQMNERTK